MYSQYYDYRIPYGIDLTSRPPVEILSSLRPPPFLEDLSAGFGKFLYIWLKNGSILITQLAAIYPDKIFVYYWDDTIDKWLPVLINRKNIYSYLLVY